MADGSRHSLYVVQEAVLGITPTNPALELVRITGTTLGLNKDSLQSEEIRSDRQITDFRLGANQVGGDINFELSYGSFDDLLAAVLLSEDWTGNVIQSGQTRRSFTFVRHFADIASVDKPFYVYRGVEINSMSLSISASSMITGSFSVVGQSQETMVDLSALGAPTFPAPSITSPLDSFTGTLNEGGTPIAVITEISLTLENNITPKFVVGSKNALKNSVGRSNLTGTITACFEDSYLVDKFIDETESDIVFQMPDGAGNNLEINIPRIKYTGGAPDVTDEGPITLSMPYQALLDDVSSTNLIITGTPA